MHRNIIFDLFIHWDSRKVLECLSLRGGDNQFWLDQTDSPHLLRSLRSGCVEVSPNGLHCALVGFWMETGLIPFGFVLDRTW